MKVKSSLTSPEVLSLSRHRESACNTHGSGPSAGPRRFQTLEAILLFYLGLSESDEGKHWGRAMACCRIRFRCLRTLSTATVNLLQFHSHYADSYVSNAVAKRKANTFSPCSQTQGKLHDSSTREHPTNRTPISPIFSVHKTVADVTSPTFLHTLAYVQVVQAFLW